MKKLTTALISAGLFLSCNAFALTPECSNCGYASGLSGPKYSGGFYLGVTGAYIHPSESSLGLFTDSWQYLDSGDVLRAQSKPFDPDRDWAWGINLGYDIPCTSTGIEFTYFHFQNKTHAVNDLSDDPITFASLFFPSGVFAIAPAGIITELVSDAFLHYTLKQADLKVTQQYNDVCGHFQLRPGIGLRYAKIEHSLSFHSPSTSEIPLEVPLVLDILFNGEVRSHFDGIGPLLTLDGHYGLNGGFGIVGRFEGAFIVGKVDPSSFIAPTTTPVSPVPGPAETVRFEYHAPKTDRVVTNITGKLGLEYAFCFCNRSSLTLEAGYQASKYYQPIDLLRGAFSSSPSVFGIVDYKSDNFTIQGPYANVTYHF